MVSFYSPYRCGSCGEEFEMLTLVPHERRGLRDLGDSEKVCTTCGGRARMDKGMMYTALAERPAFDIDDDVVAFLRSRFKYELTPDVTRFRAYRQVSKGYTYLRLSGNMATLPPEQLAKSSEGTTVIDLAGIVFDPDELNPWRTYVKTAMPMVTSLQLLDSPPGFLETAIAPEDLSSKLKVRTLGLVYHCPSCRTTTSRIVDVAENLEQLTEGIVPTTHCPTCKTVVVAHLTDAQVALLRKLPARERDLSLDRFLAKARTEPATKLEDVLIARQLKPTKKASGSRAVYIALGVLVVGGFTMAALSLWKSHNDPVAAPGTATTAVVPPATPTFQRPDWIISDVPSSAFCQDMINRLVCVGVSSYRPTRNEAVAEANDAALEELVNAIGLKISDPFFKDTVLPGYSDARSKGLSALQAVDTDRTSAAYAAADDVVRQARRRVVEVLQASGGAAVPAQRSDWYWEEYKKEKGAGTEVLVFIRYDVNLDAVKSLVDKYSATTPMSGSVAMTAFPGLAWQSTDFTGGAMLRKVGPPFAHSVAPAQIIMAVGDQRVSDAPGAAKRLDDWMKGTGDLKLTLKSGSAPAQTVDVKR
jgi:DNA-directed RNA polymerase subunit RPC12/RpoP